MAQNCSSHRLRDRLSRILIVTDSRGGGLKNYLDGIDGIGLLCNITVVVLRGATLQTLLDIIDVEANSFDYFVLCGGICDLTDRKRSGRNIFLRYEPDPGLLDALIDVLIYYKALYGNRLNIATIPPASLRNYNIWKNGTSIPYDYDIQSQQNLLFEHLRDLNSTIIEVNKKTDTETLNWAEKSFSSALKGNRRVTKFKHSKFADGVHPDRSLQMVLYRRVADIIINAANTILDDQAPEQE
jgi:hypothetical protein